MNKFRFLLCIAVFFASGVLFSGCGYHMGSMMHPQIQSIAFSDIRNDTREPMLTPVFREQLAEAFQTDNSLKIKSLEKADCVLYCRIVSVSTTSIRERKYDNTKDYRPAEFSFSITAEFCVRIPGRGEELIPTRTVTASANYQYNSDPNVGRYYGMRQACYNLSRLICQYTTEAW